MLAAMLAAGISCSKADQNAVPDGPKAIVSFGATVPEPGTRIAMDSEGKTTWVAGDKIQIYYDGGSVTATTEDSGETATFTTGEPIPTDKVLYCAIYPSTREAAFDGSTLTANYWQNSQPGTVSKSAICVASTTTAGGALAFHNTGAMVMFTTTSNKIHEAYLTIGSNTSSTVVGANGEGSETPYAAGTYYVPVPAGTASTGFALRLKNNDGEDYPALHRPASRNFEAGHVYNVGTVENKVLGTSGAGLNAFRLMSFNILRGDLKGPDHLWSERKDACLAMIAADAPDIIGLQECSSIQRDNILSAFPKYGAVGVSVKGAKITAYPDVSSNPILYDGNKFLLERWGTFWLSETPNTVSNTWYYNKPRTATWAQFRVKGMDLHFVYICLHLQDNSSSIENQYKGQESTYGPLCRAEEINVVTDWIDANNPNGYPVIVSGDFNSAGTESYYSTLSSSFSLARLSADTADTGPTLNSFTGSPTGTIDNIFYTSGLHADVFAVDRSSYAGVTYISDHYPVYCDFRFFTANSALDGWDVEGL